MLVAQGDLYASANHVSQVINDTRPALSHKVSVRVEYADTCTTDPDPRTVIAPPIRLASSSARCSIADANVAPVYRADDDHIAEIRPPHSRTSLSRPIELIESTVYYY